MKFLTLTNVALRSFFLEASWNNQGQQNLGLAAAVDPALKLIYGSGEALRAAQERAIGFFNTNPILSGLAIGVIIKMEEDVAAGRLTAENRVSMSASLNRALATLGDAFFWHSWLPLCCLAAVWACLSLGRWWAPLILPALFCLPALPVRLGGLYWGYRQGEGIVDFLYKLKIQRLARICRRAMALLTGVSTVILVFSQTPVFHHFSLSGLWAVMALVAAAAVLLRFLALKTRILHFWYPLFLVAVAGLILIAFDKLH
jgi:PTS system mannose-specific IID component